MAAVVMRGPTALAVAEIVLVAASLRAVITAVTPVIAEIRADLGLSSAAAGMLTTLPLIAFAVFSTASAAMAARFGLDRILAAAMALVAVGALMRSGGTVVAAFAGTAVLGSGIAAGNVLLPGVVKKSFPAAVGIMTSVYVTVMVAFAGLGAAASVPLAEQLGMGWRGALAVWAVVPALGVLLWLPRAARRRSSQGVESRGRAALPWRSRLAWQVTVFMGTQSLVFYGLVAWLPELLRADGVTASGAGLMLGLMQLASLASTIAVPVLAGRQQAQRPLVVASGLVCLAGFVALIVAARELAAPAAVLLGLGSGAWLSLALTFFIHRSPSPASAASLSAMAQSVGYAIAAAGPTLLGAVHDATGSWTPPLMVFLGVTVVVLVAGLGAARDRTVGVEAAGSDEGREGGAAAA